MPRLGIGLGTGVQRLNLNALPQVTKDKLLFLWTGKFSGNNLLSDLDSSVITVTGKDFSTDYIPATSAATFAIPDNATYKGADTDNFWHSGSTILQKTVAQMVATDNDRTFFRYADEAPYHLDAMAIAKADATFDSIDHDNLSRAFHLWMYYFGTFNDYGHFKENRPIEEDPYCPEFRAVYDSWTTKPPDAWATEVDTRIRALVDGGVWAKLDCFEFFAPHTNDASEALKDWVNLSRSVTTTANAPTFTAYQGFLGVPANSTAINTGFIPSEATNFQQNNNHIGIYCRTARAAGSYNHGCYNAAGTKGVTVQQRSGAGNFLAFNNSATAASQASTSSQGHYVARRDASNSMDLLRNAVEVGADKAINTNARPTVAFYVHALNTDGTLSAFASDEISVFHAGAYLDNTEMTLLTNSIEAILDFSGKGVIA